MSLALFSYLSGRILTFLPGPASSLWPPEWLGPQVCATTPSLLGMGRRL
jgi:hypothetical protein